MRHPLNRFALIAIGSLTFANAGHACLTGASQGSASSVESEIQFARGLAQELGFVDLAGKVIAKLESSGAAAKQADQLALVKCQLFVEGAKIDSARRDELLEQAQAAYEGYIANNQFSDQRQRAESELIGVLNMAARSHTIALETATGEAAAKRREKLTALLESSISKSNAVVSGLSSIDPEERSEAERTRMFELLYSLGESQLLLAKNQENPGFMYEQSRKAFERLSDEAGEGSPWSLRSMVGTGEVHMAMGEPDTASDYYSFVVDLCIPRDLDLWQEASKDLSPADKAQRWLFVQLATDGLVRSLSAAGKPAEAAAAGLYYINTWKREGFELSQPLGHLSLLAVARALVDADGYVGGSLSEGNLEWFASPEEMSAKFGNPRNQRSALDLALSQAQAVNDDNRGTNLQVRAQKVISAIISRPGVKVAPEVLFEAAQGEYNDRNYPTAVESFKRVLAALDGADKAKRTELGGKVLYHIGVSLQRMQRSIEAAKAFEIALERYQGDPEYDVQNANGFYAVMRELRRSMKGDAEVERLFTKSEGMKAKFSTATAGDIDFGNGMKLFEAGEFEQAMAKFTAVGKDSDSYEKAQVFLGACSISAKKYAEGEKVLDRYLNSYLKEPANAQVGGMRATRREEARAAAYSYWGLSQFKQAEASGSKEQWAKVIELLEGYHTRFKGQDLFAAAAFYRVMIAHLKLGDRPKAKAVLETLLKTFPENKFAVYAAQDYYKILKDAREKETDPEKKRALLREMAENMQIANRGATAPKYANLRNEADHWMELGEWATAEELLVRIRDNFGATEAEKITSYVLPDLGKALVMQRKVQAAQEVLQSVVRDETKKATRETATTYARAVGGWLETEAGTPVKIVVVPGVGGAEAFKEATDIYVKLEGAFPKYSAEWYENKFQLFYVYYRWSQIDSKKLEFVQGELKKFATDLGAGFEHENIAPPLRAKYKWLHEKVGK